MQTKWVPPLTGAMAARATEIAKEVARRCVSPSNVQLALQAEEGSITPDLRMRWHPSSVAGGDAGIALLATCMHACFPGENWDIIAHQHLSRAITNFDVLRRNFSVYSGVSGLAFIALLASEHGKYYSGLRRNLDSYFQALPVFIRQLQRAPALHVSSFDLISGIAGAISYLITASEEPSGVDLAEARTAALEYLVSIASNTTDGYRCYIQADCIEVDERKKFYPKGYSDTGLAHGVSGVVAALAVAVRAGYEVPGIKEGLSSVAHWLAGQYFTDQYGINWRTFLSPSRTDDKTHSFGPRAAWCYGIPGIARALFMAGDALHDVALTETALAAYTALTKRPRFTWGIVSPNICHGLSGILQSTIRVQHEIHDADRSKLITRLIRELFSLYTPESLFGFQDRYAHFDWYDNPRFLNGAPGVALALLAASQPVAPRWDRILLLS